MSPAAQTETQARWEDRIRIPEPGFLTRARLRARRRALWLRRLWSSEETPKGVAITPEEVGRVLMDPAERAAAEARFYETDDAARELTESIETADRRAEEEPRWRALRQNVGLTPEESDLLSLAATVALDPAFGRVCGYLQDDANACYATPALAAALFGWTSESSAPGSGLAAGSALARWRLAEASGSSRSLAAHTAWTADPYIVQWLLGDSGADPAICEGMERIPAFRAEQLKCLDPATMDAMQSFLHSVADAAGLAGASGAMPVEMELNGPPGSGKRTLAAQLCAKLGPAGRDLLVVDTQMLLGGDTTSAVATDRLFHAVRAARLEDAVLYWNHAELLSPSARHAIEGLCDLAFFGSEAPGRNFVTARAARQSFRIASLGQSQRLSLWRHFTAEPFPEAMNDWSLRPAEIRAAAQIACAGPEAVQALCRRMLHQEPGELLSSLPCPYGWDDIVLPSGVRRQLEELSAQARLRPAVLEEWGFGRLCPAGRGITALFAGPSGTGKTMAAQVVAHALGRELCRVDLAEVVNKYIGETEKRLKRVFDACERSAVVLFFDEADALFGQRTEVKDAHDRYANIQIDYLLQRMEQFDGVAILATNRKNDLDSAFLRRLRFVVDFLPPGPPERLTLWRLSLAEYSPSGEPLLEGIEWAWLADNLILTGADIKAATLSAAFLARAEGSRIRMEHLLHAVRREMSKHGTSWRASDWTPKGNG